MCPLAFLSLLHRLFVCLLPFWTATDGSASRRRHSRVKTMTQTRPQRFKQAWWHTQAWVSEDWALNAPCHRP
ncbi:hypothetical protein IWX49DRAFT_573672 [Phyllosticta citricarpa]|uniref:Secreted protein n=1 Tax=Phyllosticta citricarpa TaxID=55181 RepID=A0ABR1MD82_9PEZI